MDPKTGLPGTPALLGFGIRAQSLEDQQALIERMRARSASRGAGRAAGGGEVGSPGLPVIAAAAASISASSRYWLTLAGLVAVALVLLLAYRSVAPGAGAAGSGRAGDRLVVAGALASEIPLNPMSAALGALTIAIATEFSVILSARFHEERGGGWASPRRPARLRAHRRRRLRLGRDRRSPASRC